MASGLQHVRGLLGSAADSGLSDKEVKDSLWYYFFDAEQTVEWLLAEREKNAKKGKKQGQSPVPVSCLVPVALRWPAVRPMKGSRRGSCGVELSDRQGGPFIVWARVWIRLSALLSV